MIDGYAYITLLVDDQDEALRFYQEKIGLEVRLDVPFGPDVRWVTVAPKDAAFPELSLTRAVSEAQRAAVGRQAADTVLFVLTTPDIEALHTSLSRNGVQVLGDPEHVPWGRHFLFKDLYGNLIDVLQPAPR